MKKNQILFIMKGSILPLLFLFMGGFYSFAQERSIRGTVTDSRTNITLPGVNVVVAGTTRGTITDLEGRYFLEAAPGEVLVFSFVGYQRQQIPVGEETVINVSLAEDVHALDEVVVIGYGIQRKSDLTGAVASISQEEITAIPVSRLEQTLQGRASGVFAQSVTGAPGSNVNVRIRGITSINQTDPMWIVDGVAADPRTVNPSDVESIEILKDASTAAIYGAQGANGVILVTTKRGKPGVTEVSFNASFGVQEVSNYLDLASGPQFAQMYNQYQAILRRPYSRYYFNDYLHWKPDPAGVHDSVPYFDYASVPTYDYQKEIFRRAPMHNYDLGISGGNENSTFYVGVGYTAQEGILYNSAYENINLRLNSDHKANNWLRVGQNLSVSNREYSGYEEWQLLNEYHTPIMEAINYHPFVPVTDSIGPYVTRLKADGSDNFTFTPLGNTGNPVANYSLLDRGNENLSIKATAYAIIEPLEGLTYESRFTGDLNYGKGYDFSPIYFITASNRNDNLKIHRSSSNYKGWQWQHIGNFNRTIADDHNVHLMAGFEAGYGKAEWMGATRWDMINATPEMWYFNASTNDTLLAQLPSGAASESAGYSYFGRVSYDYRTTFLGQFNIRKDYSSKFGPRNRSGIFPSFSAGIKFTDFQLVRDIVPWLSFGKVRYGWGKVGNNAIPDYAYFSTVALANVYMYNFDDRTASVGAARNVLSNPAIKWEGVVTSNIGLDLGFVDNRLLTTIDFFQRYNDGMLMTVEAPGYAGFRVRDAYHEGGASNPIANIGKLENRGIEFNAIWKDTQGRFAYDINFNFTYVQTKAVEISPDTIFQGSSKGMSGLLAWTIQGQAIGEYYGYATNGIFKPEDAELIDGRLVVTNQPYTVDEDGNKIYAQPNAQPGDFRFVDINGDGRIDSDDIGPIGNPNPPYIFGLNFGARYRNFDLSVFLQGVYGNKIFNASKFYLFNTDGGFNWSADYVENHYREDIFDRDGHLLFEANHDGKYPRLDPRNANENFTKISDFYMEDGSYLRLRNLQVGYTLPHNWSSRAGLQRLRIYVSASNLFTLTRYSGYDPDIGSTNILVQGLDKAAYPNARVYTMGVNLNF